MTLFPLDAVRNAGIDRDLELVLEDVREEAAAFPFPPEIGGTEAVLEAFDLARPRLNVLAGLLRDCSGQTGLDISTGLGFLPVILRRLELQVAATEAGDGLADFARTHSVKVIPYRIGHDPLPLEPNSQDFLLLAEVIEHLKIAPLLVIRELATVLRPGGRFLLTTPNIARLSHIEALAAGENFLEPFPDDLPLDQDATDYVDHVREYSIREVVEAMEGAGLAVERVLMTGWGEGGYQPLANPFANEIIVIEAVR